ncbi:MAG: peptidylprolyl isomerase, partial [Thermomicrobiales bacterium]
MSQGSSRWPKFGGTNDKAEPAPKKKRVSRHEQNLRRERYLRIGMAIALGLLVLVLAAGALNEYYFKPRATLATVNGVSIPRSDYWKARAADLNSQAAQYQQFAQFSSPDQAGQFEDMARQAIVQIPDIWGSTKTDPGTLNKMIEDQLYLQGAQKMGLVVTPDEAETWALSQFAPFDAPLLTPVPTPTYIPARAEMMTATAASDLATQQAADLLAGTQAVVDAAGATPVGMETPTAAATPSLADTRATAEAGFAEFGQQFFPVGHLNKADYLRLVAMPNLARQQVQNAISADVGQSAPMVEASHILVETKELADKLEADLASGADFAELAKVNSTDTGTAPSGGDLGWFSRDEMVKPFSDVAFALKPGEISAPVETEFGWHIIKVKETDPERPLTDQAIGRIAQARQAAWLDEQR